MTKTFMMPDHAATAVPTEVISLGPTWTHSQNKADTTQLGVVRVYKN